MKLARFANGSPEIFRTLQGEGPSMGCPAVFLRLSLCNLHCTWCDTPFTWNWEGTPWPHQDERKFSKAEHLLECEVGTLTRELERHTQPGDRLVVTGGEPLLQQKELVTLLQTVAARYAQVEVETNGTQTPGPELDLLIDQYNVSPKLNNSGNAAKLRHAPEALAFFANSEKAFFKFVVQSEEDLAEILLLLEPLSVPKERVLLMPEGRSAEALAKNRSWIAQQCLKHGFRLTDRLHVQLWGDERGR